MNFIAAVLTIVAIVLFIIEARTPSPSSPNWRLGWIGFACLATALLIWHGVGGLEPVITPD